MALDKCRVSQSRTLKISPIEIYHVFCFDCLRDFTTEMSNSFVDNYLNEASKLDGDNYIDWKFKISTIF